MDSNRGTSAGPLGRERAGALFDVGEWIAVGSGLILLLALFVPPWFAVSADGFVTPGSEDSAFRWLEGIDAVLLAAGLIAVGGPALRRSGAVELQRENVAVVVAAAGLVATVLVLTSVVSPPEPQGELFGALGNIPGAESTPRGGALLGLAAAAGILAGGVLTITGVNAAAAGRAAPTPPMEAAEPVAPVPEPAVRRAPARKPTATSAKPAPKKAATRKPKAAPAKKAAPRKATATKPKAAAKKTTSAKSKPAAKKTTATKPTPAAKKTTGTRKPATKKAPAAKPKPAAKKATTARRKPSTRKSA